MPWILDCDANFVEVVAEIERDWRRKNPWWNPNSIRVIDYKVFDDGTEFLTIFDGQGELPRYITRRSQLPGANNWQPPTVIGEYYDRKIAQQTHQLLVKNYAEITMEDNT